MPLISFLLKTVSTKLIKYKNIPKKSLKPLFGFSSFKTGIYFTFVHNYFNLVNIFIMEVISLLNELVEFYY